MKLKIEGKLRDGFFEWFTEEHGMNMPYHIEFLEGLPQSAQFGLLQEYADTLGYRIETQHFPMVDGDFCIWIEGYVTRMFDSRHEAQVAAIDKLNEIVNQLKDK